jgi:hypothetical protein
MNFFSAERFTNALQAVGNIIAPLPDDYRNEAPSESHDPQGEDGYGSPRSLGEEEEQGEEEGEQDPITIIQKLEIESSGTHQQELQISSEDEQTPSLSPPRESQSTTSQLVDSDTESKHSEEDLSPLPSPHFNQLDEAPSEDSQSLASLREELEKYKSKIASTFSEISSLAETLREALSQNRDLERQLELERDTQRLMSTRLETLSQSKEALALQLSDVLQSREKEQSWDLDKEIQRRKESEAAQGVLAERYQLVVDEKVRLTEALFESEQKAQKRFLESEQTVRRVFESVAQLLEEIDRVGGDAVRAVPMDLTAQSIGGLVSAASDKLRSFETQIALAQESHRSFTQQIQQMETRLTAATERGDRWQSDNEKLEIKLSERSSRCSLLEERLKKTAEDFDEEIKSCRRQIASDEERIRSLEARDQQSKAEDQRELAARPLIESTSLSSDDANSLKSRCEELSRQLSLCQRERDAVSEFYRSCVASTLSSPLSASLSVSESSTKDNRDTSLLHCLEDLRQLWKALELKMNESQCSKAELASATESLTTEHQIALKAIDQLTKERDGLQADLRELRSSEALKKQAMSESKQKIDDLFQKILEMKQIKEENDALKLSLERLSAESKRELVRWVSPSSLPVDS